MSASRNTKIDPLASSAPLFLAIDAFLAFIEMKLRFLYGWITFWVLSVQESRITVTS